MEKEIIIFGRNCLLEAIKKPKSIRKVLFNKDISWERLSYVISILKANKIIYEFVDSRLIDKITETDKNQGVLIYRNTYEYEDYDSLLAGTQNANGCLCILDNITDPYNYGAIIRSAAAFGINGIITEKRNSAPITDVVYKSSAGTVDKMKIAEVTNINHSIDELKEENFTIYGLDINGSDDLKNEFVFNFPCAIVIGSEGKGISEHTKKRCDKLIKIPIIEGIDSLNVSVASGITFYEIFKKNLKNKI